MSAPNELMPKMWEILNSLSDDARKSALKKCKELEFDPDKGSIPLDESLINLGRSVKSLSEAIEKKKLIQLPLSIQRKLLIELESVASFLSGLNSGADEVVNLVNSIENLNSIFWEYGLHNLSKEVLGFETKMNQLKSEETSLGRLREELEKSLSIRDELAVLLEKIKASDQTACSVTEKLSKISTQIEDQLQSCTLASQNIAALAASVGVSETTSKEQVAVAKTSASEILAMEAKFKKFFGEIDEYETKIETVSLDAKTNVAENRKETSALVEKLKELEDQIKVQIEKATGFSLFHSFQTRQDNITSGRRFWAGMLAFVILISLGLTAYIAHTTTDFNIGFYLKLSMTVPLIYGLSFCTIQYSRERRLEEEYAFKSAISISLDPYQSLVSRIMKIDDVEERKRFIEFILDSIRRVFTSPMDKIYEPPDKMKAVEKSMKRMAEIAGAFAKAAKP